MDGRVLILLLVVAALEGCAAKRSDVMIEQRPLRAVEVAPATRPVVVAEREVVLGQSVEGREIVARVLGSGGEDVTLVMGAIHGNEPSSAVVAEGLLTHLRCHPELLAGRCVVVLAIANPDGLARRLRTNERLVDLNRNFPAANWAKTRRGIYFGGNEAGSEPETLALIKLFEELRPARVVSIHSMDRPCNNYDGPGRKMAEVMSGFNGYAVKDNIGYATPGSLGSWAGIDRGIPIVTLELPRRMGGEEAWEGNREALLAVVVEGKR